MGAIDTRVSNVSIESTVYSQMGDTIGTLVYVTCGATKWGNHRSSLRSLWDDEIDVCNQLLQGAT
jgi:hypothetical protein